MSFDAAYEALTDHDDDARWAYGTGFTDPLAGVDTAVPAGVDRAELAAYCLMLGDDALIMSHRLQQWVTRAPELEDELAIANIGLDLLGQARLLLSRAAEVEDAGRDEDALAYLRDEADFRNVRLAERADADFAHLVARLLAFATWRLALLDRLTASADPVLAAIAAKGVKEVTYHRDYAAQWVVRLGDGTALSHDRMQAAMDAVTPLAEELFASHEIELSLAASGVAVDPSALRPEFDSVWAQVLDAATLRAGTAGAGGDGDGDGDDANLPAPSAGVSGPGGRHGVHTPAMAEILAELQGLARTVPGGVW
ncbi:1,2-phenylacetyl-CoA epoxidase subunit PaaC [Couchioplanes caeruleus]|uniref:Phenylacetate-CoA oxygenase subunit PaaI n=2 Tax=Couchioplanes caeruleus TaxID=56438 RepID=A0A1K0FHK6_9ACTN|nr:1,2-phenylacetyl-CoA epoxidase subunit PaaC [Couchioplanes caeruleus]OJF12327.1 phenylacetate-CoA oxygenase subunit PaaI [Couchioplanes caeruleus subsp. caeruleus]ROP34492.1 ring-1,2-phenylacetyl-CoA epoxidase subunit PaaC [Couchioplanes caeruleus]